MSQLDIELVRDLCTHLSILAFCAGLGLLAIAAAIYAHAHIMKAAVLRHSLTRR